jgi:uncharacterized membrane protein YkoI
MEQVAIAQNRTGSTSAGVSLNNLTGSVQVFPGLSQTIQSKAKISLSTAATIAEKSVSPSSHAVSAHVGIKNGYLVYSVRIVDSNNNLHWIIADAGNGKVLLSQQLPLGNAVIP